MHGYNQSSICLWGKPVHVHLIRPPERDGWRVGMWWQQPVLPHPDRVRDEKVGESDKLQADAGTASDVHENVPVNTR